MSDLSDKDDKQITVIIVNDEPEFGEVWGRLISRNDDMVCPAYAVNGFEAIELAQEYRPDVMLMDIMMPDMDGLETTRRILAVLPDTLIIGYSAHIGMEVQARDAGAVTFLLMPVTPDALMKTIRRVYQEYRSSQES